jgi:hypothetical protein
MRDQMMLTLLVYRDRGRRCQTADKIHRYEGRVDRNRNQAIGILLGRPFEPGGKAGERPEAGKRAIWQNQKREGIKTAGIAIGADRDFLHLRCQPGQKMRDQRLAPQLHECFIGAAQARPGATGEDQTSNHVLIKPGIKPGIKRGIKRGSNWGERRGSNPRQPVPQTGALPTELRPPSDALHQARWLVLRSPCARQRFGG